MRKSFLLIAASLITVVLSACGELMEFETNVEVDDQTMTLAGETNIEDGAIIHYEVTNFEVSEILDEGTMEVQDGAFSTEIDASDFPAGEFEIYSVFLPYEQSDEIQGIYGSMGEEMELGGPVNETDMGDESLRVVEERLTFEKN